MAHEYHVFECRYALSADELNKMCIDGWEFTQTVVVAYNDPPNPPEFKPHLRRKIGRPSGNPFDSPKTRSVTPPASCWPPRTSPSP